MKVKFKIRHIGTSKDLRTNTWEFTCKCGKVFNPPTTVFSKQHIECPKCNYAENVNYNDL